MRKANRCQRCNGGAVPAQGMLCLGCRNFLAWEERERRAAELRRAAAVAPLLATRGARRRWLIVWTPDPRPSNWGWIIAEVALTLVTGAVFLVAAIYFADDPLAAAYCVLLAVVLLIIGLLQLTGFLPADNDADARAPNSENSGEP
jgi:hypothetical protein